VSSDYPHKIQQLICFIRFWYLGITEKYVGKTAGHAQKRNVPF
jgi:hypothetical protein